MFVIMIQSNHHPPDLAVVQIDPKMVRLPSMVDTPSATSALDESKSRRGITHVALHSPVSCASVVYYMYFFDAIIVFKYIEFCDVLIIRRVASGERFGQTPKIHTATSAKMQH